MVELEPPVVDVESSVVEPLVDEPPVVEPESSVVEDDVEPGGVPVVAVVVGGDVVVVVVDEVEPPSVSPEPPLSQAGTRNNAAAAKPKVERGLRWCTSEQSRAQPESIIFRRGFLRASKTVPDRPADRMNADEKSPRTRNGRPRPSPPVLGRPLSGRREVYGDVVPADVVTSAAPVLLLPPKNSQSSASPSVMLRAKSHYGPRYGL